MAEMEESGVGLGKVCLVKDQVDEAVVAMEHFLYVNKAGSVW